MNNLQANFSQIVEFAQLQGVPTTKLRSIVREYLQARFVANLFTSALSNKLCLVGGTGLRLLRNLDRFSEDLDFDNLGLSDADISHLVNRAVIKFQIENIIVELIEKTGDNKINFEMRFPELLFDLGITSNPREKLKIKFYYSNLWKGQSPEIVLFNKYGMFESIPTNPIHQVLVQKMTAYVKRKRTQPRDLYDVVWLYAQGARLDQDFMVQNGLEGLLSLAKEKYTREGIPATYPTRLRPFLFDEQKVRWLNMFESVLQNLEEAPVY